VPYSELEKLLSVSDGGGFVIQELLGYNSSRTMKIYMHVIDKNV